MQAVILAGGLGTRITEESRFRPKPMVEVGGMPILWHIMKIYSSYGIYDFIICAGYKQNLIKEWFSNYFIYTSDVTFDLSEGQKIILHEKHSEPWRVTVVDTGIETMTGGRLRRVRPYIKDETFLLTYGDGVCDVDINDLIKFHRAHGKIATLTSVLIDQSKGVLSIGRDNTVKAFREKSVRDGMPINAGFMVFEKEIFDLLTGDACVLEQEPLMELAKKGELMSYTHHGFWQCMDTLREKIELEKLWESGNAPWKVWQDD